MPLSLLSKEEFRKTKARSSSRGHSDATPLAEDTAQSGPSCLSSAEKGRMSYMFV